MRNIKTQLKLQTIAIERLDKAKSFKNLGVKINPWLKTTGGRIFGKLRGTARASSRRDFSSEILCCCIQALEKMQMIGHIHFICILKSIKLKCLILHLITQRLSSEEHYNLNN